MMICIPYGRIHIIRYLMIRSSIAVVVTDENSATDADVFLIEIDRVVVVVVVFVAAANDN